MRLALILLVVVVAMLLLARLRDSRRGDDVRFTPVEQLPEGVRARIDTDLAASRTSAAVRTYRAATGHATREAQTAIDVYRRGGRA